jgi:hypothetical protein
LRAGRDRMTGPALMVVFGFVSRLHAGHGRLRVWARYDILLCAGARSAGSGCRVVIQTRAGHGCTALRRAGSGLIAAGAGWRRERLARSAGAGRGGRWATQVRGVLTALLARYGSLQWLLPLVIVRPHRDGRQPLLPPRCGLCAPRRRARGMVVPAGQPPSSPKQKRGAGSVRTDGELLERLAERPDRLCALRERGDVSCLEFDVLTRRQLDSHRAL